jgi:hypothetical protein
MTSSPTDGDVPVRSDTAGATHDFIDDSIVRRCRR